MSLAGASLKNSSHVGLPWMPSLFSSRRTLHPRPALHQEQAQPAPVGDLRLAAGQHQQHLAAAVGDESLHAADEPVALGVLPDGGGLFGGGVVAGGLDRLEVAAGVRLGEDHRPGPLAAGHAGQVLLLDRLIREGVDGLGDALEAVEVHQRGVGPADDVVAHRVDQVGAVQPAEAVRQREAHQVGLAEAVQGPLDARGAGDRAVGVEGVAQLVGLLGRGGDCLGGQLAQDGEDSPVVVHRVGGVGRGEVKLAGVREVVLHDGRQARHVHVLKEKLDVLVVREEVCHGSCCLRGGRQKP